MAYIGVSPSNGIRRVFTYTATANQTSFSGVGAENITLSYKDANYVDVYQNGVKLASGDYTATSGTAIVLGTGATVNDMVVIVVFDVFSAADTVSKADGGQFDGNVIMAGTLAVTGTTALTGNATMAGTLGVTGVLTGTSLDISGDIDVDGVTNLDNTDIDGTLNVQGETTLQTHLNMGDNDKIKLGASGDLEIYHDTNHSYVEDTGTGELRLKTNGTAIRFQHGSETLSLYTEDGSVELYHNDSKKFETASGGVTVTGDIANASGDFLLDVAGELSLDAGGGEIKFKDDGTVFGQIINSSTDLVVQVSTIDKDFIVKGKDDGSTITALTLDMSAAGTATFNHDIKLSANAIIDCAGNLRLDAESANIVLQDTGTVYGTFHKDGSNFRIRSDINDADIVFDGYDGGSIIRALTLDMSASGDALFNRNIDIANDTGRVRLGAGTDLQIYHDGTNNNIYGNGNHNIIFYANNGEKLRIRNGGFLRISNDLNVSSHSRLSSTTAHVIHSNSSGNIMCFIENTTSDPRGMMFDFSQAAPDNNSNFFMKFEDSSAERAYIYSDGDMYNHDGTFAQLSDTRIKDNITDANAQWDDIKAMRFVNYQRKDDIRQYGADKAKVQLGLIGQELEAVSPNLIRNVDPHKGDIIGSSEFGTLYEDGDDIPEGKEIGDVKEIKDKVKGVAYSILYMKAVKALQEAMTRIETLEAKVTALESA